MKELLMTKNLFDLNKTIAKDLFFENVYPWQVLPKISEFIINLGCSLPSSKYKKIGNNIWIANDAKIAETSSITGPAIICTGAQIRHCAFIRGSAIVGNNAVVGNSTELKNVILFDNVQVPHYNYVGDSILGFKSHMGAGSITSNVKSDKTFIKIKCNEIIETGLKKFGAILGDNVEVGCNSVLNPGTIVGKNSTIYPLSMVRGFVKPNVIYKSSSNIVTKDKK